jgi:hypothetical protein
VTRSQGVCEGSSSSTRKRPYGRGIAIFVAIVIASTLPAYGASASRPPLRTYAPLRLYAHLHTYSQQIGATRAKSSTTVSLGLPYSWWNWGSANASFQELSQPLTIDSTTTGAPYFWSHQFHSQFGDGGFVGLQDGSFPNHTKIALFSVWAADGAEGGTCRTFSGEGDGWTCRIDPYNWVAGRRYIVSVRIEPSSTSGAWYVASITDTKTRATSSIGRIHVPDGWGQLQGWVSWTEYFGARPSACSKYPRTGVRFDLPTANSGAARAIGAAHVIGTGDCPSQIESYSGGDHQIVPLKGPAARS